MLLGIQVITHNNQGGKLYKSLPHITAKVLLGIQVITHNNQGGKLYKRLPHNSQGVTRYTSYNT